MRNFNIMSKLTYRISYYVLYALFAAIVVVCGLFYFDGFDRVVGEFNDPVHTETLIYLIYFILGLCVLVTLVAAVIQFGSALVDSPVNALKSLVGLILLVALLAITWSMGSTDTVVTGDGPYTDPFWLKITDMFLYSIYVLMAGTILSIFVSGVKKSIS